ncbi:hypothetical protein PRZ48_011113 [Zasmidium cellare]|uniref:Uncharacterized protein n=1 Tax=Zasmidium cellare TaxID=395010 RepID=A0ABR0EAI2_ZASCE|nr:hypothetical protein PRZ48_011113 [Zasmidium cellare]
MAKLKPEPKPTRARSTRIKDLDTKKKREEATKGKSDAGVKKKTTAAAAKKKTTATAKKVKDAVAKKAPAVKKAAAAAKPAAKKTAAAAKPKAKSAAKEVKKAATTKKAAPKKTTTAKKPAAKTTKKTIAKKPAPKKTPKIQPYRPWKYERFYKKPAAAAAAAPQTTSDDDFAAKEAAVRAAYVPSPAKSTAGRGKKSASAAAPQYDGSRVPATHPHPTGLHRLAYELAGLNLERLLSYDPAEALSRIEEHLAEQNGGDKKNKASPAKSRTALHRRAFAAGGATLERLLDEARDEVVEYIEFLESPPQEQATAPPPDDSSDGSNGSDSSSSDISIPIADIFRRAYIAGGVPLVRQTYEQQNVGLAKIFEHERAQRQAGKKGPNLSKEPNHVDHEHRHAWYLGGPGLVALLDSNPKKARADIKAIGNIVPRLRSRETGLHRLAEELGGSRLHFLLSYTPAEALSRIEEELAEKNAGKKKKTSPAKSGGRTALHRRAFNLGGATLERLLDHADAREGVIEYIEFLEGHPAEQTRAHAANKEEEDRQERGDLGQRAQALGISDLRDLIYGDIDEARRRIEGMEAKAQGKGRGKGKGKTPSPAKSTRRSASPVKSTRRSASPVKSTTQKKGKTPSPTKSTSKNARRSRSPVKWPSGDSPTEEDYERAQQLGIPIRRYMDGM